MPYYAPGGCDGVPHRQTVPAGTVLWRVHGRHRVPDAFNEAVNDRHVGGGRFSSTEDCRYPYLYLAYSAETALAETLLRSLPFDGPHRRMVPRAAVTGRRLSAVLTTAPIVLLRLLTSPDLAQVCQDEWLVHAEPRDYGLTRRWAHWLRQTNPWAQGLVWQSRRNLGESTTIVFGDRCDGAFRAQPERHRDLDDLDGAHWLNERLAGFGARVALPNVPNRREPVG